MPSARHAWARQPPPPALERRVIDAAVQRGGTCWVVSCVSLLRGSGAVRLLGGAARAFVDEAGVAFARGGLCPAIPKGILQAYRSHGVEFDGTGAGGVAHLLLQALLVTSGVHVQLSCTRDELGAAMHAPHTTPACALHLETFDALPLHMQRARLELALDGMRHLRVAGALLVGLTDGESDDQVHSVALLLLDGDWHYSDSWSGKVQPVRALSDFHRVVAVVFLVLPRELAAPQAVADARNAIELAKAGNLQAAADLFAHNCVPPISKVD